MNHISVQITSFFNITIIYNFIDKICNFFVNISHEFYIKLYIFCAPIQLFYISSLYIFLKKDESISSSSCFVQYMNTKNDRTILRTSFSSSKNSRSHIVVPFYRSLPLLLYPRDNVIGRISPHLCSQRSCVRRELENCVALDWRYTART